jgi:DNA-directed RNA polymerase specialized sigma subunit
MSESESREVTPRDADQVVRMEKNSAYNPAVSTEEVAEELEISTEEAFDLLEEASRPSGKPVGDSHVWW